MRHWPISKPIFIYATGYHKNIWRYAARAIVSKKQISHKAHNNWCYCVKFYYIYFPKYIILRYNILKTIIPFDNKIKQRSNLSSTITNNWKKFFLAWNRKRKCLLYFSCKFQKFFSNHCNQFFHLLREYVDLIKIRIVKFFYKIFCKIINNTIPRAWWTLA